MNRGGNGNTPVSGRVAGSRRPADTTQDNEGRCAAEAAVAREAALRAARIRRQAERNDKELQDSKRRQDNESYQQRYKVAARRWLSSIIALPILLVTSYYLFDRLVLGHDQKVMPKTVPADQMDETDA
ncbi:hypothetical protein RJ55_05559 [Drechmeria coniospora]|nr:hypothetical protein RJ55_05559 [Drechmeria coniospora]